MNAKTIWIVTLVLAAVFITALSTGVVLALLNSSQPGLPPTGATPEPRPILTSEPVGPLGSLSGLVWHDLCIADGSDAIGCAPGAVPRLADGALQPGEPGLAGVVVQLASGVCPGLSRSQTITGADGSFRFTDLAPGGYCVSIDSANPAHAIALAPGSWTYPARSAGAVIGAGISVSPGQEARLNFGWDYRDQPQPAPEPTPTSEPLATPTSRPDFDPQAPLGSLTWRDVFANGRNWPLYEDEHVGFSVDDAVLTMQAFEADGWDGWMLTWPKPENYYLSMNVVADDCQGLDRYGLMFRATKPDDVYVGYLFGVSCDGRYSLRSWDGEHFTRIIDWTSSAEIHAGSEATNRLGVLVQDDSISLYANGQLLTSLRDDTHQEGRFGVFVGSVNTEDYSVDVTEISLRELP